MPKTKPFPRRINTSAGAPDVPAWPAWLTQVAFVLALAAVYARGTMLETVRDAFDITFGADAIPRGPGPAASLVLDLLCCIPALLVLVRRAVDRSFSLRLAWSHAALFALALWAMASNLWAADRFTSLVTGAHVVAAAALMWAVAQLVRSWLRLRLVAGVCFGLLLACLAHGLIYRYVDLPDMQRSWEKNQEEIRKQRNWEPGSFQEKQFANKILNGEMIGFHVSPNAFAAVIVMLTVVSLGLGVQRITNRDEPAWLVPIGIATVLAILMIYWTHSKAAMATFGLAVLAFVAIAVARPWLANHSRKAYWAGLIICVLGIAAVAGHGIYRGGLFPGHFSNSLHFRWRYWVAAERMFETQPVLGVGWGNFGNWYTKFRLPEAAEEVRDPHDFIVRAFVELGVIGGALLLVWLARMGWELTRPIVPPAPLGDGPRDPEYSLSRAITAMGAIAVIGLLLNIAASVDFAENWAYAFIEVFKRILYACLLLIGGLVVVVRSSKRQELDGRAAPWVLYGCLIALATLLVQNLIDISLFEAGPMMSFAMLAGAAGGVRAAAAAAAAEGERREAKSAMAIGSLIGASAAWAAAALLLVIPVISAQNIAYAGDIDIRWGRMREAARKFQSAFAQVPSNADFAFRSARALIMANADPAEIRAALDTAAQADPTLARAYLFRAEYEKEHGGDADAARANYEKAVALNPADLDIRERYANALAGLGLKNEAADELRTLLSFNDKLPPDEPERLPAEKVKDIEKRIAELSQ
jgi:O-antigen ligase/tetratricopeptide (TPR) repeat protein